MIFETIDISDLPISSDPKWEALFTELPDGKAVKLTLEEYESARHVLWHEQQKGKFKNHRAAIIDKIPYIIHDEGKT